MIETEHRKKKLDEKRRPSKVSLVIMKDPLRNRKVPLEMDKGRQKCRWR